MFYDADGKVIIIHYLDSKGKPATLKYTPGIKPAVNNTFVQQVHEAISAVMKNDDAKTFQGLSINKNIVNIKETTIAAGNNRTQIDKLNGNVITSTTKVNPADKVLSVEQTINWNPNTGLKTASGGGQAPSTGLLHEGGHAVLNLGAKTIQGIIDNGSPTGDVYDTKSDKQIITGLEINYINKTNLNSKTEFHSNGDMKIGQTQSTRTTHQGSASDIYNTTGVNSITPAAAGTTVKGTEDVLKGPPQNIHNDRLGGSKIQPMGGF